MQGGKRLEAISPPICPLEGSPRLQATQLIQPDRPCPRLRSSPRPPPPEQPSAQSARGAAYPRRSRTLSCASLQRLGICAAVGGRRRVRCATIRVAVGRLGGGRERRCWAHSAHSERAMAGVVADLVALAAMRPILLAHALRRLSRVTLRTRTATAHNDDARERASRECTRADAAHGTRTCPGEVHTRNARWENGSRRPRGCARAARSANGERSTKHAGVTARHTTRESRRERRRGERRKRRGAISA